MISLGVVFVPISLIVDRIDISRRQYAIGRVGPPSVVEGQPFIDFLLAFDLATARVRRNLDSGIFQHLCKFMVGELAALVRIEDFRRAIFNFTAIAIYRDALERDPNSSDAISGLATCHWHNAINGWSVDSAKSGEAAMRRAKEAVAMDANNYNALGTVSIIQTFGLHEIDAAEITARKSIDMNPSDILTRHYLVCSLEFGGKFDEAVEQCKYMMALDPCAPSLSVLCGDLSTCLLLAGQPLEAVEYSYKSMEADPDYARGRQRLIAALVAAGDMKAAEHEYAILQKAMPNFSLDYVKRTYPFVHDEHLQAYSKYFAAVGVQ